MGPNWGPSMHATSASSFEVERTDGPLQLQQKRKEVRAHKQPDEGGKALLLTHPLALLHLSSLQHHHGGLRWSRALFRECQFTHLICVRLKHLLYIIGKLIPKKYFM